MKDFMQNEFFNGSNGWERGLVLIVDNFVLWITDGFRKDYLGVRGPVLVSLSPLVFQSEFHTIELVQGSTCPRSSLVKEFASCQAAIVLSWSGMVSLDNLAHQKGI